MGLTHKQSAKRQATTAVLLAQELTGYFSLLNYLPVHLLSFNANLYFTYYEFSFR